MQETGYLQLDRVPVSSRAVSGPEDHLAVGGEDEAVPWQPEHTRLYKYSIAFQPSYSVPILLFSGRKLGKMSAELCECLVTTLCRVSPYLPTWWTLSTFMSRFHEASIVQQGQSAGSPAEATLMEKPSAVL